MPGGNKKVTHTKANLQLKAQRSAAGLFKYVWPFCYHQVLKGYFLSIRLIFEAKYFLRTVKYWKKKRKKNL